MLEVELQPEITAPGSARALLREWLWDSLSDDELEIAMLLVSELVTNAVRHGQGRITMRARLNDGCLLVDVLDEGIGPAPAFRKHDFDPASSGGRGLMIVDAASSRWGIQDGTAHVWFELERTGIESSTAWQRQPTHC